MLVFKADIFFAARANVVQCEGVISCGAGEEMTKDFYFGRSLMGHGSFKICADRVVVRYE